MLLGKSFDKASRTIHLSSNSPFLTKESKRAVCGRATRLVYMHVYTLEPVPNSRDVAVQKTVCDREVILRPDNTASIILSFRISCATQINGRAGGLTCATHVSTFLRRRAFCCCRSFADCQSDGEPATLPFTLTSPPQCYHQYIVHVV